MEISRVRTLFRSVLLITGTSIALLVFLTIAESKMEAEAILPNPPQIQTEVISYEFDLLKVTSNWPKSLTVENISDKDVSGLELLIVAANDDGGPGELVLWGRDPNYAKQTPVFRPKEVMTLPISPQTVKKFQENGKSALYIQVFRVWVNNDPEFVYSEGSLLQQDEKDPGVYHVIRDAKGRNKAHHNPVM